MTIIFLLSLQKPQLTSKAKVNRKKNRNRWILLCPTTEKNSSTWLIDYFANCPYQAENNGTTYDDTIRTWKVLQKDYESIFVEMSSKFKSNMTSRSMISEPKRLEMLSMGANAINLSDAIFFSFIEDSICFHYNKFWTINPHKVTLNRNISQNLQEFRQFNRISISSFRRQNSRWVIRTERRSKFNLNFKYPHSRKQKSAHIKKMKNLKSRTLSRPKPCHISLSLFSLLHFISFHFFTVKGVLLISTKFQVKLYIHDWLSTSTRKWLQSFVWQFRFLVTHSLSAIFFPTFNGFFYIKWKEIATHKKRFTFSIVSGDDDKHSQEIIKLIRKSNEKLTMLNKSGIWPSLTYIKVWQESSKSEKNEIKNVAEMEKKMRRILLVKMNDTCCSKFDSLYK